MGQHHGVVDNHTGYNLDLDSTWMEALQRAGYRCGGYGKLINGFGVDPQPPGRPPFPYWASRTVVPPGFDDFHMLVNFDASAAPQVDMPWLQAYRPLPMSDEEIGATLSEHTEAMRALMAVNEGLKAVMDRLQARGELDNTVIVVATDNSHIYGAWGLQDKGTAFEDSLNLMLRIRHPGVASGSRPQAVSNIDLAPFFCELAGAQMRGPVDGVSFVPTLKNARATFREAAPFGCTKDGPGNPAMDGLRFVDRKVTRGAEGGTAAGQAWAHDLLADPWELVSQTPAAADLRRLDKLLRSF